MTGTSDVGRFTIDTEQRHTPTGRRSSGLGPPDNSFLSSGGGRGYFLSDFNRKFFPG